MEKAIQVERIIPAAAGGALLPWFEYFYGSGPAVIAVLMALIFFIGMDWLSGYRASKKDKSYSSKYGIDGVFRTFFMICLPAGGHFLDVVLGMPGIVFGILAAGLLFHTIKSMTANAVRAGWGDWLPIGALEKVAGWVESEIDSKMSRARKRLEERGGTANEGN